MNLFTLFGKIGLDDKEYFSKVDKVMKNADRINQKLQNVKALKPKVDDGTFQSKSKGVRKTVDNLVARMKIKALKPTIEISKFNNGAKSAISTTNALRNQMKIKPLKPDVEIKKFDGKAKGVIKKADLIKVKLARKAAMKPAVDIKKFDGQSKSVIKKADLIKVKLKKKPTLKPAIELKKFDGKAKGVINKAKQVQTIMKKTVTMKPKIDSKNVKTGGKTTISIVDKIKNAFNKGLKALKPKIDNKDANIKGKETTNIVARLKEKFVKGIEALKLKMDITAFKKKGSEAEAAMNQLKDTASKVGGVIDKWFQRGLLAASGAMSVFTAAGINNNAMLETSKTSWETLLGSQEKAVGMLQKITDYAATTPFSKMGVDEMAKQLHNAGYEGDNLFNQLTMFGDMGSAFGVQEESLREMVRQYAQVQMAGVAYTEDLNILQDRGIPIYKALSEVLGVSVADVKKLTSEGKVNVDVYNAALESIAQKADGAMVAQSRTFSGLWSTFKDTWANITQKLSEPIFDIVKEGLLRLQPVFDQISDMAGKFAENVKDGQPVLQALKDAIAQVFGSETLEKIQGVVDKIIGVIKIYLTLKGAIMAFQAVSAIAGVISGVATAFGVATGAGTIFAAITAGLPLIIAAVVAGAIWLGTTIVQNWDKIKEWTGQLGEKIAEFGQKCLEFFTVKIPEYLKAMVDWFAQLPERIWEWLSNAIAKIGAFAVQVWQKAIEIGQKFVENMIKFIKELPVKLWNFFLSAIQKTIEFSLNMIQKAIELGTKFVAGVIDFVIKLPFKLWEIFVNGIKKTIEFAGKMWEKAKELGSKFVQFMVDFIKKLPANLWAVFVNTIQKTIEFAGQMWNKAKELGRNFVQFIIDVVKGLPAAIWNWFKNTISKAIEFGKDMGNKAKDAGKMFVDMLVQAVKDLPRLMMETGKSIVRGIWDGITGMGGWLFDKLKGFVGGIKDSIMGMIGGIKQSASEAVDMVKGSGRSSSGTGRNAMIRGDLESRSSYGIMKSRKAAPTQNIVMNQTINTAKVLSAKEIGEETRKMQQRMEWRLG